MVQFHSFIYNYLVFPTPFIEKAVLSPIVLSQLLCCKFVSHVCVDLFLGSYYVPSEKAMAPHSSTLAWKIPWTESLGAAVHDVESDATERLHFHFSLSCIGEGNGNPFQCSCLENPRDGGAWWAAVYGVTQSRTRLK